MGDLSPGNSLSDGSEGLLRKGKGRARIYRSFLLGEKKKSAARHQKITANHRQTHTHTHTHIHQVSHTNDFSDFSI